MQIFKVGPEELGDNDFNEMGDREAYLWLVYWYQMDDCYSGGGWAVALGKDDILYCKGLGHCSCYGPMNLWSADCDRLTIDQFLHPEDVLTPSFNEEIRVKVVELLSTCPQQVQEAKARAKAISNYGKKLRPIDIG